MTVLSSSDRRRKPAMPKHQKVFYQKIAALSVSVLVLVMLLFGIAAYQSVTLFPDRGLEAAIRENLARPNGLLTRNDLQRITHLDASGRNIVRLEGMAYLRRLVVLNLKDNQVKDLSPLRNLNRLTDLDLRNNGIINLEAVNFSALAGLRLRRLSLRHNVVRPDQGGQIRLADIRLLAPFTSLEVLELRDNHIADITPLSNMVNLQTLDLRENRISDIGPLKHLVQLQYLNLRDNRILNLDALSRLTALTYLNIHSNSRIRSIQPLLQLTSLQTLIMRHVSVGNQVRLLRNLANLQKLNVRNCGISDVSVLRNIGAAQALYLNPDLIDSTSTIRINEVMASNGSTAADEDGAYSDWIELYNFGSAPVDLGGWGLSDRLENPFKWTFPEKTVIDAGEHLLIWASGKNRGGAELHTCFSISRSGEEILLTEPHGAIADILPPLAIPRDISAGYVPVSGNSLAYFAEPTPGAANTTLPAASVLDPVQFSHTGGIYTEPFKLILSHPDPNTVIVYTSDGSVPDIANLKGTTYMYKNQWQFFPDDPPGEFLYQSFRSAMYTSPLYIRNKTEEPDKLARVSASSYLGSERFSDYNVSSGPVRKGTVIRATAVRNGHIQAPPVSHSYFVFEEGNPVNLIIRVLTWYNTLFFSQWPVANLQKPIIFYYYKEY